MIDLLEARLYSFRAVFCAGMNMVAAMLGLQKTHSLIAVTLEVTNCCNLKCSICPTTRLSNRPKGHMSFDLAKKIIDDNPRLEYIQLYTWGEPLLNRDFFKIVDYIADHGIRPCTVSNGTLLDEDMVSRLVASRIDRITISMDGTGKYYEDIRGFPYAEIEQNVNRLIDRRNETKSNLRIELNMSILESNEENVEAFIEAWQDKVDRIQIQPCTLYVVPPGAPKRTEKCIEPWSGNLYVHWDGQVAPCCVDFDNELIVGDATRERLVDILNGKKMCFLRKQLARREFPGFCSRCIAYSTHTAKPMLH